MDSVTNQVQLIRVEQKIKITIYHTNAMWDSYTDDDTMSI